MNILWAGAEYEDFPLPGVAGPSTTAGRFRANWARCAINMGGNNLTAQTKGAIFNGGAVTSAWISCQANFVNTNGVDSKCVGFGQSSSANGLCWGFDSGGTKFCIFKYDGTTTTRLAIESGTTFALGPLFRVDMQVISYGASGTVNLYVNGVSIISFTGNLAVSGMTNMDSVTLFQYQTNNPPFYSEIFVADSDTRAIQGMQTMLATGAGTTNNWTNNTFSNINALVANDGNATYVNTATQDQQYNVTDMTPPAYSVVAVVVNARIAKTAGSTPTQVKLGYNSGGTVAFGTGATKTPSVGFTQASQIDHTNPVTGVAFAPSDMNALQLDLRSA